MNRTSKRAVWVAFAIMMAVGCNPASLSYFLFKGDGKAPADHPLAPPEGRKEIRIAIMMAAPNAPVEFAGIDRDLARRLGDILVEQSKEGRNPIRVVDQSRIEKFKLNTPGWKTMTPAEMGRQLGADYVIDAKVMNLGMYEAGSGKYMYQGQGSVSAEVFDTATGKEACPAYYVNTRLDTKPSDTVPASQYRALLVQRIAEELSWKHLPHVTDKRVSPVQ